MSLLTKLKDKPGAEVERLQKLLEQEKRKRQEAEQQNKQLQAIIDLQLEQLERRVKVFKSASTKAQGKTWYRVIVPDSHGSLIDRRAAAAFLRDVALLRP